MTLEEINKEERELFGDDFNFETESTGEYMERCRKAGEAMDKFFETLPPDTPEDVQFQLWMATDEERAAYLKEHAPKPENQPYFQRTLNTAKTVKVGGFRI